MNFQEIMFLIEKLNKFEDKLLYGQLTEEDIREINKLEKMLDFYITNSAQLKRSFGSIKDYQGLLDNGFSKDQVKTFMKEDKDYVKACEDKLQENIELREHMFGYPANMATESSTTQYLRFLESKNINFVTAHSTVISLPLTTPA